MIAGTSRGYQFVRGALITVAVLALVAAFAGLPVQQVVAGPAAPEAKEVKNPFAGNDEAISEGKTIFKSKCAECHGDGTGGTGADLTDDEWIHGGSDAAVFETVSFGRATGGMPQWRSELSKDEIWKVIAYVRSLRKK